MTVHDVVFGGFKVDILEGTVRGGGREFAMNLGEEEVCLASMVLLVLLEEAGEVSDTLVTH